MSLSSTEKVRRHRERQKEKERAERLKGQEQPVAYSRPFNEFFLDHPDNSQFMIPFDWCGIPGPDFTDDRGPEAYVDEATIRGLEDPFGPAKDSLGRAEIMVACLLDAAAALAQMVNEYKSDEIKARMATLEEQGLGDPTVRKAALKELMRLSKLLENLEKQVRWSVPVWKTDS